MSRGTGGSAGRAGCKARQSGRKGLCSLPLLPFARAGAGRGRRGRGSGEPPAPGPGAHAHTAAESDARTDRQHPAAAPPPAPGSLRTMAPGLQLGSFLLALAACLGAARLAAGAAGGRRGPAAEACAGRVSGAEQSGAELPLPEQQPRRARGSRKARGSAGFRGAVQPSGRAGRREGALPWGHFCNKSRCPGALQLEVNCGREGGWHFPARDIYGFLAQGRGGS